MFKKWNDCIEIYKEGEFLEIEEPGDGDSYDEIMSQFHHYCTRISTEPESTVWYDFLVKRCFGSEETFFKNPNDFSLFPMR